MGSITLELVVSSWHYNWVGGFKQFPGSDSLQVLVPVWVWLWTVLPCVVQIEAQMQPVPRLMLQPPVTNYNILQFNFVPRTSVTTKQISKQKGECHILIYWPVFVFDVVRYWWHKPWYNKAKEIQQPEARKSAGYYQHKWINSTNCRILLVSALGQQMQVLTEKKVDMSSSPSVSGIVSACRNIISAINCRRR